jgi:hypothetical protein
MALELVANVGRVLQALAVERRNIDRQIGTLHHPYNPRSSSRSGDLGICSRTFGSRTSAIDEPRGTRDRTAAHESILGGSPKGRDSGADEIGRDTN